MQPALLGKFFMLKGIEVELALPERQVGVRVRFEPVRAFLVGGDPGEYAVVPIDVELDLDSGEFFLRDDPQIGG